MSRRPERQVTSCSAALLEASLLLGVCLVSLLLNLSSVPVLPESADATHFLHGLQQYGVARVSPQWPGYPLYLLLGHLAQLFTPSPVEALHAVSVVSTALNSALIVLLAWRLTLKGDSPATFAARLPGVLAGTLWMFTPAALLSGTEIYSDGPALSVALLALLATLNGWLTLAGALSGAMLGVRLAYLPLIIPWLASRPGRRGALAFLLFTGAWFGWQLVQDGPRGYLSAAGAHLTGHYTRWGGTALSDHGHPLPERPVRAARTFLTYGLGVSSAPLSVDDSRTRPAPNEQLVRARQLAALMWTALAGALCWRPGRPRWNLRSVRAWFGTPLGTLTLWALPYAGWIFVNQDVSLDRYFQPLVASACVLAGVAAARGGALLTGRARMPALLALLAVGAVTQAGTSVPLLDSHHRVPTALAQIGQAIAARDNGRPAVLLTYQVDGLLRYFSPGLRVPDLSLMGGPETLRSLALLLRLQAATGPVYAIAEDTVALRAQLPGRWTVVTHVQRGPLLRSREFSGLTLLRWDPGNTPGLGDQRGH